MSSRICPCYGHKGCKSGCQYGDDSSCNFDPMEKGYAHKSYLIEVLGYDRRKINALVKSRREHGYDWPELVKLRDLR